MFLITQGRKEKQLSTEGFLSFSPLNWVLKSEPAGEVRMKWIKTKFYPTHFSYFQSPNKISPESVVLKIEHNQMSDLCTPQWKKETMLKELRRFYLIYDPCVQAFIKQMIFQRRCILIIDKFSK